MSVDTSNSGSSRATWSPTALYHLVMVPSVTVSPSCGMVTSGNVEPPSGQGQHRLTERLGQRRVRLDELGHLVGGGLPVDGQVPGPSCSVTHGPTMCTPRILPAVPSGCRSATTFTSPSVSPMIRARLFPPNGSFFTTTSNPASVAAASVSPAKATSGWQ